MTDTPTAAAASPTMALDAHYYSGGLRVRRLGDDPAAWVPNPPERYAGFRDEVPFDGQDQVVEIARLLVDGRRLWWIALYRRSVDDQLGNRGNHAGVGVWIGDGDVAEPALLLGGLRQLTGKLVDGGVDQADQAGRSFLASYLPTYLEPAAPMPPQLDGWSRAGGPMPVTALFAADLAADGAELAAIAELISHMALLPGPTADHSRAIVLLRAPGSSAGPNLAPLPRDLAQQLVALLPVAMAAVSREYAALTTRADRDAASVTSLRGQLAAAQASESDARATSERLQRQISEDDDRKRHQAITDQLARIQESTRRVELALPDLKRGASERPRMIERSPRADGHRSSTSAAAPSGDSWEPYIIGSVVTLLLIGLAFLIYLLIQHLS